MNYPSLSLSIESIQKAFKVKQPKSNIYIQGRPKQDFQLKESPEQICEKCSFKTLNLQTMRYHIASKHSAKKCNICDFSHAYSSKMKEHVRAMHQATDQTCDKCDFKTLKFETMRSHIKTKHSNLKKKCTDCDYSHPIDSKVKAHHRQVHLGVKRSHRKVVCRQDDCQYLGTSNCPESEHCLLYCEQCEFSTIATDYLKKHKEAIHSGEAFFSKCKQCDYKTRWSSCLTRHEINKHMDEQTKEVKINWKKCTFENCLFKTPFPIVLKRHIESKHEGIVHFRCKYMNCAYMTNDKRSFKDHSGIHTHNSLLKCHYCEKVLGRARNLKSHIRKVHGGTHLLKCSNVKCTFEANQKEELQEHILKHTDEEFNMKVEHINGDPQHEEDIWKNFQSKVELIKGHPELNEDTWKIDTTKMTENVLIKTMFEKC